MIALTAGLGMLAALLFGLFGLAVHLWGIAVPHGLRWILWGLPVVPFAMLACLIAMVAAVAAGI